MRSHQLASPRPKLVALHGSNDLYGAGRVLLDDVEILSAMGLEVTVVLPEDGPLSEGLTRAGAEVNVCSDLRVIRRVRPLASLRPPIRLPAAARNADIALIWTLALAGYLPTVRARGIPAIVSVHEILPGRFGSALAQFSMALASAVMTNSLATTHWLEANGAAVGVSRIAYPVAPQYEPFPPRPVRGPIRALLAGRVNGHKGHIEAIRAVQLARREGIEVDLELVGGSFPGQERHLHDMLETIHDQPGITYVGEVRDVRPYLANADIMLVPTTRPEPFGIVALEAWAAGRRVIGSDEGGLAEAVRMVDGLAVASGDITALAESIKRFAQEPSLRTPPPCDLPVATLCTKGRRRDSWRAALHDAGIAVPPGMQASLHH